MPDRSPIKERAHAHPSHHSYLEYGGGDVPAQDRPQEAHWATLSVPISVEEVRVLVRKAAADKVDGVSAMEGPAGFVLVAKQSGREIASDVGLTGWAEGTQVHVAEARSRHKSGVQVFVQWLNRILVNPR